MSNLALSAPTSNKPIQVLTLAAKLGGSVALFGVLGILGSYMQARSEARRWPPEDVVFDNYISLMLTFTLLMSFVTAAWARYSERRGDHRPALVATFLTAGLGVAALNALVLVFQRLGYGPADTDYATFVYASLIVAGLWLGAALAGILAVGFRASAHQTVGLRLDRLRAATTFWQFAVVGWLFVYATIYLFK